MKKHKPVFRIIWGTLLALTTGFLIVESCLDSATTKVHTDVIKDIIKDVMSVFKTKTVSEVQRIEVSTTAELFLPGESFKLDIKVYPETAKNKAVKITQENRDEDHALSFNKNSVWIDGFKEDSWDYKIAIQSLDNPEVVTYFEFKAEQSGPKDVSLACYYGVDVTDNEEYIIYQNIVTYLEFIPNAKATLRDIEIITDENIEKISNHCVKPLNITDDAKITVKGAKGFEKVISFKIRAPKTSESKPDGINKKRENEGDEYIAYQTYPINLYVGDVKYVYNYTATSSNDEIFTIDEDRRMKMISEGQATLTVTLEDGYQLTKVINCKEVYGKPKITEADENQVVTLYTGFSQSIVPVFPDGATYRNFTLTLSDPSLSLVDISHYDGQYANIKFKLEPEKAGTCTMTLTADNGDETLSSTYTLKVVKFDVINELDFYNLIRKGIGHFALFLVDGALLILFLATFKMKRYKQLLFSLCGVGLAFLTEAIQHFVPSRNGNLSDVLIDTIGFMTGFLLIFAVFFIIFTIKKHHKPKVPVVDESTS